MTTIITNSLLTEKEASKRLGVPQFVIRDAILLKASYDRLPAVGADKGFLISAHDLDRWAESLTPRERLMVFPCTRKGCAAAEDHWPHVEGTITPDGRPIHGYALEDNRPKDETGWLRICKTGEPDPDHWQVFIKAIGAEPWTVGARVFAKDEFPLRERGHLSAEYVIPDAPGLLAALTRAQAKADKLNARR
jgi:hypothetical protein